MNNTQNKSGRGKQNKQIRMKNTQNKAGRGKKTKIRMKKNMKKIRCKQKSRFPGIPPQKVTFHKDMQSDMHVHIYACHFDAN